MDRSHLPVSNMKKSIGFQRVNLDTPIATKVVCFARLLKCLRSLYGKQCGPQKIAKNGGHLSSGNTITNE